MDVKAIIILGGAEGETEKIAGVPLASLDVLGRSVLLRIVDRLARFGISSTTIICDRALQLPSMPQNARVLTCGKDIWQMAAHVYSEAVSGGADLILTLRLGPYSEIDYDDLIQFHLEQSRAVTAVLDSDGEASSAFVFSASPCNEALYLFRHQLKTSRQPYSVYAFSGYSNQLRGAADLRRLAIDSFCRNADLTPQGVEVKPGVWVASNAAIHNSARIVAPAYIGAHAKVRAAAVVTRCSVLEHHAHVGAGAVVDNATLLPNTRIGPALDVAHAVVGFNRLAHLGRNVEVEISDHRLVGSVSPAPVRLLEHVAYLAAYLPAQFLRGLASSNGNGKVSHLPSAAPSVYPALAPAAEEEFPADFVGVRRYGND
jgi:hypothetical protein